MPEHFTYKYGWRERKCTAKIIVRWTVQLYNEWIALRLLLLFGKGFTAFQDVRTINAVEHPSFAAAARAASYLRDDAYFEQSLREASSFHMPIQLLSCSRPPSSCPFLARFSLPFNCVLGRYSKVTSCRTTWPVVARLQSLSCALFMTLLNALSSSGKSGEPTWTLKCFDL